MDRSVLYVELGFGWAEDQPGEEDGYDDEEREAREEDDDTAERLLWVVTVVIVVAADVLYGHGCRKSSRERER